MTNEGDLICFSSLRYGSGFHRPRHLMGRAAREHRTFFIEPPRLDAEAAPFWQIAPTRAGPLVCVPHLRRGLAPREGLVAQQRLLDDLLDDHRIEPRILWFCTPAAFAVARHIEAPLVVYDCMDEPSPPGGAPVEPGEREQELLQRAHLVFTARQGLSESEPEGQARVHTFPSGVDAEHFASARGDQLAPDDQHPGLRPRIGFFGVIDERVDLELVAHIAAARPDWHLVMLGPIVESVAERVRTPANLHWLGPKPYAELPRYLAGWDVAILPFALNEATRFISPHQTLEYLAAGRPVVSTAIQHVVHPFAELGLVRVADRERFVFECAAALTGEPIMRRLTADLYVSQKSWEQIWAGMKRLMRAELKRRSRRQRPTYRSFFEAHLKSKVS